MRIVDVCAFYTPHGGGVKTYIDSKLAAAGPSGHEIVVIAPGECNAVTERGNGAILVTVASPALPVDRRYRYFSDEAALHRAISQWRPDFIEASSPWSSASMVGRWPGSVPRSLVMHADPLSAYAYRWFGGIADIATIDRRFDRFWQHLRRLDKAFDCVVSANENLTTRLLAGGVDGAVTIPMGIPPGVFSPRHRDPQLRERLLARCQLPPEATLLLGAGRYSAEKRWTMVIDAVISAGAQTPVGLLLLGDGRNRRGLEARAAGSPHIVIGAPIRDRQAFAATLASADALVHGCDAETFCMVGAEARASGLPVIMPDRGGAADHAGAPSSRCYRAADPAALRDAILDFSRTAKPSAFAQAPICVRTTGDHFDHLFQQYLAIAAGNARPPRADPMPLRRTQRVAAMTKKHAPMPARA